MFIQTDNFGNENTFRCRFHEGEYNYPMHIHQFTEIAVVLKGKIDIICAGERLRTSEGDIVVIPPFRTHSFETPERCDVWISVFSNAIISDFLPETELYDRGVRVFGASSELMNYIKPRLIYEEEKTEKCIKASLYAIMEEYTRKTPLCDASGEKSVLSSLFLYLNGHFKEDISLSSTASALGYSASYISHALGAIPDLSFTSILSGIRVEHAKKLLLTTDLPTARIALDSGFSCERSFHRAFMKQVGKTPTAYKRESGGYGNYSK